MYAPLFSCLFLSSKLDSPVIKTLRNWSFLVWESASPIFWLQANLIWMKEAGNWTEVHTYWNYLLQNQYFSNHFKGMGFDKTLNMAVVLLKKQKNKNISTSSFPFHMHIFFFVHTGISVVEFLEIQHLKC